MDVLILKMISGGELYGYQIRQEIENRSNGLITIKEGSLYGPLYRMEKREYISSRRELVGKKRFRIYYQITEKGKNYLKVAEDVFHEIYEGAKLIIK